MSDTTPPFQASWGASGLLFLKPDEWEFLAKHASEDYDPTYRYLTSVKRASTSGEFLRHIVSRDGTDMGHCLFAPSWMNVDGVIRSLLASFFQHPKVDDFPWTTDFNAPKELTERWALLSDEEKGLAVGLVKQLLDFMSYLGETRPACYDDPCEVYSPENGDDKDAKDFLAAVDAAAAEEGQTRHAEGEAMKTSPGGETEHITVKLYPDSPDVPMPDRFFEDIEEYWAWCEEQTGEPLTQEQKDWYLAQCEGPRFVPWYNPKQKEQA